MRRGVRGKNRENRDRQTETEKGSGRGGGVEMAENEGFGRKMAEKWLRKGVVRAGVENEGNLADFVGGFG